MVEWIVDVSFNLLLVVGLPALFLVFLLKGAIVGKILPTSVFLPGYILAISAGPLKIVLVLATTSIAYFVDQLVIYRYSGRYGIQFAESIPGSYVTEERLTKSTTMFDRYGGRGIFLTNCIPFLGGLLFVPAGITRYSLRKTFIYGYSSTLLYQTVIVFVALGVFQALLRFATL